MDKEVILYSHGDNNLSQKLLKGTLTNIKKRLILIIIVSLLTIILKTSIYIWLSKYKKAYVPSIGTIRTINVKIYGGDLKGKDEHQYIDWGTIYPVKKTYRSFYIQSMSNVKTILKFETYNWIFRDLDGNIILNNSNNPSSFYFNIDWNYTDMPLEPKEIIFITFCLNTVSDASFINYLIEEKVTDFSFEIIISASEQIN